MNGYIPGGGNYVFMFYILFIALSSLTGGNAGAGWKGIMEAWGEGGMKSQNIRKPLLVAWEKHAGKEERTGHTYLFCLLVQVHNSAALDGLGLRVPLAARSRHCRQPLITIVKSKSHSYTPSTCF